MGVHQNFTAIGSERCVVKERSLQRKKGQLKDSWGLPKDSPASPPEVCEMLQSLTTPGKVFSLLLYPIFRDLAAWLLALLSSLFPSSGVSCILKVSGSWLETLHSFMVAPSPDLWQGLAVGVAGVVWKQLNHFRTAQPVAVTWHHFSFSLLVA